MLITIKGSHVVIIFCKKYSKHFIWKIGIKKNTLVSTFTYYLSWRQITLVTARLLNLLNQDHNSFIPISLIAGPGLHPEKMMERLCINTRDVPLPPILKPWFSSIDLDMPIIELFCLTNC